MYLHYQYLKQTSKASRLAAPPLVCEQLQLQAQSYYYAHLVHMYYITAHRRRISTACIATINLNCNSSNYWPAIPLYYLACGVHYKLNRALINNLITFSASVVAI